jgi:hypothetical protein
MLRLLSLFFAFLGLAFLASVFLRMSEAGSSARRHDEELVDAQGSDDGVSGADEDLESGVMAVKERGSRWFGPRPTFEFVDVPG